jgi:hypothetical protein
MLLNSNVFGTHIEFLGISDLGKELLIVLFNSQIFFITFSPKSNFSFINSANIVF